MSHTCASVRDGPVQNGRLRHDAASLRGSGEASGRGTVCSSASRRSHRGQDSFYAAPGDHRGRRHVVSPSETLASALTQIQTKDQKDIKHGDTNHLKPQDRYPRRSPHRGGNPVLPGPSDLCRGGSPERSPIAASCCERAVRRLGLRRPKFKGAPPHSQQRDRPRSNPRARSTARRWRHTRRTVSSEHPDRAGHHTAHRDWCR